MSSDLKIGFALCRLLEFVMHLTAFFCKMHMSYWFGTNIGDFLFDGFTIVTTAGFISTCFGLLSIAVLFEGVKIGLVWTRHNTSLIRNSTHTDILQTEASTLLTSIRPGLCSWSWITTANQFLLFISREMMSYTLMLAVMTYNGYFTISIIIGGGLGFFIFSPLLMELGLRNGNIRGPMLFCGICKEKLKRRKDHDEDSLAGVAQGVIDVANVANNSNAEPAPTIAVVQIHSNEPQVIA